MSRNGPALVTLFLCALAVVPLGLVMGGDEFAGLARPEPLPVVAMAELVETVEQPAGGAPTKLLSTIYMESPAVDRWSDALPPRDERVRGVMLSPLRCEKDGIPKPNFNDDPTKNAQILARRLELQDQDVRIIRLSHCGYDWNLRKPIPRKVLADALRPIAAVAMNAACYFNIEETNKAAWTMVVGACRDAGFLRAPLSSFAITGAWDLPMPWGSIAPVDVRGPPEWTMHPMWTDTGHGNPTRQTLAASRLATKTGGPVSQWDVVFADELTALASSLAAGSNPVILTRPPAYSDQGRACPPDVYRRSLLAKLRMVWGAGHIPVLIHFDAHASDENASLLGQDWIADIVEAAEREWGGSN